MFLTSMNQSITTYFYRLSAACYKAVGLMYLLPSPANSRFWWWQSFC